MFFSKLFVGENVFVVSSTFIFEVVVTFFLKVFVPTYIFEVFSFVIFSKLFFGENVFVVLCTISSFKIIAFVAMVLQKW